MDKLLAAIVLCFGFLALIGVFAVIGGTLVYFLWPVVATPLNIPILSWWQCVCLSWLCGILFKSHSSSSSK